MHAIVAARLGDQKLAERYFRETAATDLEDTTAGGAGGVRIAALGRLWQAGILGFAGLGLMDAGLRFEPRLPREWNTLSFRVQWRGRQVEVSLDGVRHRLSATLETGAHMRLYLGSQVHALDPGQVWESSWDEPLLIRELHAAA